MLENILAFLFPPELPGGSVRDAEARIWQAGITDYNEPISCGVAQPKKYRDAIERVQVEGF